MCDYIVLAGHLAAIDRGATAVNLAEIFAFDDRHHTVFSDEVCAAPVGSQSGALNDGALHELAFVEHHQQCDAAERRNELPTVMVAGGYGVNLVTGDRHPLHFLQDHFEIPLGQRRGASKPYQQHPQCRRHLCEAALARRPVIAAAAALADTQDSGRVARLLLPDLRLPSADAALRGVYDVVPRRDQRGSFLVRPAPIHEERRAAVKAQRACAFQRRRPPASVAAVSALMSQAAEEQDSGRTRKRLLPMILDASSAARKRNATRAWVAPRTSDGDGDSDDDLLLTELAAKRRRQEGERIDEALHALLHGSDAAAVEVRDVAVERWEIESSTRVVSLSTGAIREASSAAATASFCYAASCSPLAGVAVGVNRSKVCRPRDLVRSIRLPPRGDQSSESRAQQQHQPLSAYPTQHGAAPLAKPTGSPSVVHDPPKHGSFGHRDGSSSSSSSRKSSESSSRRRRSSRSTRLDPGRMSNFERYALFLRHFPSLELHCRIDQLPPRLREILLSGSGDGAGGGRAPPVAATHISVAGKFYRALGKRRRQALLAVFAKRERDEAALGDEASDSWRSRDASEPSIDSLTQSLVAASEQYVAKRRGVMGESASFPHPSVPPTIHRSMHIHDFLDETEVPAERSIDVDEGGDKAFPEAAMELSPIRSASESATF